MAGARAGELLTLVDGVTITSAATTAYIACQTGGIRDLLVEAALTYGSGGTSVDVYIQTRAKGGTWRDIMNFNFTTSSAKKFSKVSIGIALAAARAVSDAALASDTILDGFLGCEVRAKVVSAGTYAGGTTLTVLGSAKY